MPVPPETFETERLVVRRPTPADASAVYEYARDPETTRYMIFPTHRSVADAEAFLATCPGNWASGQEFTWVLTLKPDPRAVGSFGCRVRGHAADIGYILTRSLWRRGLVVEAARPIVEWALGPAGLHRVWATCDVENGASARVMEKLGMAREGTLRRWLVHPNRSPEPRDSHVYAIVREAA